MNETNTENTKLNLAATRIFTDDVDALLAFYERVTGVAARRIHPLFGEIATPSGTLAIASTQTVGLLGAGSAEAAANRSVCLDFLVDDVDADHARLAAIVAEFGAAFVNEPALFRNQRDRKTLGRRDFQLLSNPHKITRLGDP